MERLVAMARAQDIYVAFRQLRAPALFLRDERLVIVNQSEPHDFQRVALAHELGHVHHGTDCHIDDRHSRDELEADIFAARALVTPDAFRAAEVFCGDDLDDLAHELHVTRRLVRLRRLDLSPELAESAVTTWIDPAYRH